jgi:tetratricopeptide (TPR) repeat protein
VNAVICPGCDFILDTDFLGGDILDEEHQLRPGQGGVDPAVFNLADAVILGNIGDDTSSFETSDSGFHLKQELGAARLYVSGRSQAVMSPDAVIAMIDKGEGVRLTPFETHVLRFIDGKRPVESIRRQAGLDEAEVKTALANLADKGVVKVVGRALADAADFDVDTAPGNAPRGRPRRVRGTLVGAVVVVGDAADQAIDDAFRTNVRAERPSAAELGLGPRDHADDGAVFTGSDADLEHVGSDDIASFDAGGTDEVAARRRRPTSSTSTVRPAALRDAVNAGAVPHNTARANVPVLSDVDQSDGFDDFGVPSDVATAMVQQPSLSEDSSLPGLDTLGAGLDMQRPSVFADPQPLGLSDLDDFDSPGVDDLADSRVEPSATGVPLPRQAPAAIPSLSEASNKGEVSLSASMSEGELEAFSGAVWDDPAAAGGDAFARANNSIGDDDDDDNATNIKAPVGLSSLQSELSTSLSALLGSDDGDSLEPGPTAPGRMADAVKGPRPRTAPPRASRPAPRPAPADPIDEDSSFDGGASGFDSGEEPTGLRDPPPVVVRPTLPPPPARAASADKGVARSVNVDEGPDGGVRRALRSSADDSLASISSLGPESAEDAWEPSTPQDRPSGKLPTPAARAPHQAVPIAEQRGAADDLFPEDDFTGATDQLKPETKAGSDVDTGILAQPPRSPDMTLPPSQVSEPEGDDDSAWSSSSASSSAGSPAGRHRSQPEAPEPSRFDSRHQESAASVAAPVAQAPAQASAQASARNAASRDPKPAPRDPGPTEVVPGAMAPSSSAEVLDSAMVIRPAIKAVPLALAVKKAKAAPPPPPPPEDDDNEFMVDPDATLNLPALPKSLEGEARRRRAVDPSPETGIHSGLASEPPAANNNGNKRQPTEDMRRKARNLFEQAQQDREVGRLGAARMNAKLATIYDPDNETYRRILAEWERPSSEAASATRPEYVVLYELAQEKEDNDDIDGAIVILEKGVRVAPNPAAFHNRIGVLLAMRKKDYERARDEIEKAIALEPKNDHYKNNLGKVMAKAGRRRDVVANAR